MRERDGALAGLRVVEFASLGPGPHCAMLFADHGADVLRIARPYDPMIGLNPVLERGRTTIELDLKRGQDQAEALAFLDAADVLIEGFRPGVMERLGLGPDVVRGRNPKLVYGRITGWGQDGPLAAAAGHDINYVAVAGALAPIGAPDQPPPPPLNLVGDYGGGSLYLAFGILAALVERSRSGRGQVVDAAVVDGVASMMALFAGLLPSAQWGDLAAGRNLLNGGAPNYRCYRCADGRDIAVGPLEPKFYRQLLARIGAPEELTQRSEDRDCWPDDGACLAAIFERRTRSDWCAILEGSDACVSPVLTLEEAEQHPQLSSRGVYFRRDETLHPGPAPRLSRTPGRTLEAGPSLSELRTQWKVTFSSTD